MKKQCLLFFALTLALGCHKDDTNSALPPATQTGAGTFACTVNGQSFIDTSGGYFNCYYQYVDGGYYFGIGGEDKNHKNTKIPWGVLLFTFNRTISEGETISLVESIDGNGFGEGFFSTSLTTGESSFTTQEYPGELTITKMDFTTHIISGTFWFDIKNPYTGETVSIRNGRFDTLFTE